MESPAVCLIAAVGRNGVIGADNRLPWSLPGDLRHFRALTWGKPVILGRRTFESIGRPLPGRHLVILSRDAAFTSAEGAVVGTVQDALKVARSLARAHGAGEIMVAGGGSVYEALLPLAGRLYLTEVEAEPAGETRFPALDRDVWQPSERRAGLRGPRDEADFWHVTYDRG